MNYLEEILRLHFLHLLMLLYPLHLKSAIDAVDEDVGAGGGEMGAVVDVAAIVGVDSCHRGTLALHRAGVAATVDGANAAIGEGQGRHNIHGSQIVAAEEGSDVVGTLVVPVVCVVDHDRVEGAAQIIEGVIKGTLLGSVRTPAVVKVVVVCAAIGFGADNGAP